MALDDDRSRRGFIRRGALAVAAAWTSAGRAGSALAFNPPAALEDQETMLRFAVLSDSHYADKPAAGSRAYRDSLEKMRAAVALINFTGRDAIGLSGAMMLGDFVDSGGVDLTEDTIEREAGFVRSLEQVWSGVKAERHHVLGNHCVEALTKPEFAAITGARPAPYAFQMSPEHPAGGIRGIVLDACFTSSGAPYGRRNFDWRDTNLPSEQIGWLESELAASDQPAIVFVHQRLDGEGDLFVNNAADARRVVAGSGRVLAVLQGHSHQNAMQMVDGIPYVVVRAMVEDPGLPNNAFATVRVQTDGSLILDGQYRQDDYAGLRATRGLQGH